MFVLRRDLKAFYIDAKHLILAILSNGGKAVILEKISSSRIILKAS